MTLDNFNLVLLGDSFPAASIDLGDFSFMGRDLRETFRVPVALQAETEGFRLQVLPDRFEAAVLRVWDPAEQVAALGDVARTFLDYVGRRTVRAVGHNLQRKVSMADADRQRLFDSVVATERLARFLGSTSDVSGELNFFFNHGKESRARILMNFNMPSDVLLDFNFHFELDAKRGQSAEWALNQFETSLKHAAALSDDIMSLCNGREVNQ